ncbi:MAG: asparagine synthase-related protein, partial [Vicinamibacterales bacterium]
MAVQSGVLFFDHRPITSECRELVAGLRSLSPDGVSTYSENGLAMAYGALHVWTGEASTRQPVRSCAGLVMTWDGRLDNREDLMFRLGCRVTSDSSDAAIALLVFERWGVDGLGALVGDWSTVIWDEAARTLHLARDYMGVRPLYHVTTSEAVMWSTSLGELVTRAHVADELDDAFVADFMTLRFSTDVTPYSGVHAAPTATCVSISANGSEQRRPFWQLAQGTVRYRDRRQYEAHLRALWRDAVACRMRTRSTVWAELSGGLDSSSVVCMADTLLKGGSMPATDLRPLSHVTLQSADGDERRFIAEVEAQIGVHSDILGVEDHQKVADADLEWVTPSAARGVALAMAQHVSAQGGRLVLSGRVGDAVMGCEPDNSAAVFDDFAAGNIWRALRNLRLWSRACHKPFVELAWNLLSARGGVTDPVADVASTDAGAARRALLTSTLTRLAADRSSARVTVPYVRPAQQKLIHLILAYAQTGKL